MLCVLLGFCSSSVHFRVFSSLGVVVLPMRVVCRRVLDLDVLSLSLSLAVDVVNNVLCTPTHFSEMLFAGY